MPDMQWKTLDRIVISYITWKADHIPNELTALEKEVGKLKASSVC